MARAYMISGSVILGLMIFCFIEINKVNELRAKLEIAQSDLSDAEDKVDQLQDQLDDVSDAVRDLDNSFDALTGDADGFDYNN